MFQGRVALVPLNSHDEKLETPPPPTFLLNGIDLVTNKRPGRFDSRRLVLEHHETFHGWVSIFYAWERWSTLKHARCLFIQLSQKCWNGWWPVPDSFNAVFRLQSTLGSLGGMNLGKYTIHWVFGSGYPIDILLTWTVQDLRFEWSLGRCLLTTNRCFLGENLLGNFRSSWEVCFFLLETWQNWDHGSSKTTPPKLKIEQKSSLRKGKTPSKPPWLKSSMFAFSSFFFWGGGAGIVWVNNSRCVFF